MRIGAVSDAFGKSVRENIRVCRELGVTGVQITVGQETEISPALNAAARAEFRSFYQGLGLDLAAVFVFYAGHGLETASENPEKVRFTTDVIDLAVDLGCPVVASHIGIIPDDPRSPAYRALLDACREIGPCAHRKGATFCIETGPETGEVLKEFLEACAVPGIGVNMDPANLAMVVRDDPAAAVRLLGPHVRHVHAKDGIQLQPATALDIYRPSEEARRRGKLYEVKPLGKGWVDWDAFLGALEAVGFDGYLTIEAEGNPPEEYVRHGVEFLRRKLAGPA